MATVTRPAELTEPLPGLLLLHEIGGVNPSIRETARALAAQGYVVLLPDLYAGVQPLLGLARLVTGVAVNPLRSGILRELRAATRALTARADVAVGRLGVVGYSVGAAYALQLACIEPALCVAAVFCGQLPRPVEALRCACAVVASYAGNDFTCRGIPARLERVLSEYGIEHDLKTYPAVGHAFYDPWGPMFNDVASHDAWERTLSFMRRRLSRFS
jgi:carboxymethylenebutenolidase